MPLYRFTTLNIPLAKREMRVPFTLVPNSLAFYRQLIPYDSHPEFQTLSPLPLCHQLFDCMDNAPQERLVVYLVEKQIDP